MVGISYRLQYVVVVVVIQSCSWERISAEAQDHTAELSVFWHVIRLCLWFSLQCGFWDSAESATVGTYGSTLPGSMFHLVQMYLFLLLSNPFINSFLPQVFLANLLYNILNSPAPLMFMRIFYRKQNNTKYQVKFKIPPHDTLKTR